MAISEAEGQCILYLVNNLGKTQIEVGRIINRAPRSICKYIDKHQVSQKFTKFKSREVLDEFKGNKIRKLKTGTKKGDLLVFIPKILKTGEDGRILRDWCDWFRKKEKGFIVTEYERPNKQGLKYYRMYTERQVDEKEK